MTKQENLVLAYLQMMQTRKSAAELDQFYHQDVEQIEYPNAVTKTTTVRRLNDLKEASEKGSKLMVKEAYEVKNILSVGDTVLLECIWRGTMAIQVGSIPAGGQMVAYFAQVFEFKDDKIYRQRNYDCFDPFL
jgi:ketosteroid isomerase-like protein